MKRDLPKVAVDFLDLRAFLPRAAHDETFGQREDGADARPLLSAAYAALEGARVFDIEPKTFAAIYHEADVYTETVLCGHPWEPAKDHETAPPAGFATWPDWTRYYGSTLSAHGSVLPFPEHLPFPSTYLGYGGVSLTDVQRGWRGIQQDEFRLVELIGHVLTARGDAFEFLRCWDKQGRSNLGVLPVRDAMGTMKPFVILPFGGFDEADSAGTEGPWYTPYTLTPWVLTALVDLVNSYRSFVVQGQRQAGAAGGTLRSAEGFYEEQSEHVTELSVKYFPNDREPTWGHFETNMLRLAEETCFAFAQKEVLVNIIASGVEWIYQVSPTGFPPPGAALDTFIEEARERR